MTSSSLRGRRVLVLEDEPLVAMELAESVRDLGGQVLGPFGTLREANKCPLETIDLAVLDVHLGREDSFSLADRLAEFGVPFVFATGYQRSAIPARFVSTPVLTKPVEPAALQSAIVSALRPQLLTERLEA